MSANESSLYAPPKAVVDDTPLAADEIVLAGRGVRLGASIVDGLLAFGAMWLLSMVVPLHLFARTPADLAASNRITLGIAALLVFLALHGWLLWKHGQTLGKRLTGIRIVQPDGAPAAPGKLALRYGIYYLLSPLLWVQIVYSLIDCLMIFGSARRCLHDRIAGTIVVKA